MYKIKLKLLARGLFAGFIVVLFIACGSNKPHPMQYLISRNYLSNIGLSKSTMLLDLKGKESIKVLHIGTVNEPVVENYMTFTNLGDLESISKLKGENLIIKLIDFKYDVEGRINWVIPNLEYFSVLDYDSLKIIYEKGKPVQSIAIKKDNKVWNEDIFFDDNKGEYLFTRQPGDSTNELFDLYYFEGERMITEYHRNRIDDVHIDSTKYLYENNRLAKKYGVFNYSTVLYTNYDELGRPVKSRTMFSKADSIAWVDSYFYSLDERLPHTVITISPLGWREETKYYWEK